MDTDGPKGGSEGSTGGSTEASTQGWHGSAAKDRAGRSASGSDGDAARATLGLPEARVAAGLLYAQVVVIAGFVAFFLIEFALGQASDLAAVLTSLLVFVLGALGLAVLARGWARGARWPRTPTLVWQALLLPIGWSLLQTRHVLVAAGVLGVGVAGFVAAWRSPAEPRPAAGGWSTPPDRGPAG